MFKNKTIKETPLVARPREKIRISGIESLSEEELIAVILGSGIHGKNIIELSREILPLIDSDEKFLLSDIQKIRGIGEVKAMQIMCIKELIQRMNVNSELKITIFTPSDVYKLLSSYSQKKKEFLILINLNHRNEFINKKVITVGLVDCSLFHPREIFVEAIKSHASKIIVAHNHPSGLLSPSPNDLEMTKQVKNSGEILGIRLIDSVIISKEGYRSIIHD